MISTEFGIIDKFDARKDYTKHEPERNNCVAIDDDIYINDWWQQLSEIDTLNVCSKGKLQPQKSLSRWGITIIPPQSLPALLNIVVTDKRYNDDPRLTALAYLIREAIQSEKYMIHYGV